MGRCLITDTMYKMKRVMILAMAAVAALASCSKEEQSELNFSDIQGTATISGQVTYNDGHRKDGENYVSSAKPAANVPVIAKIEYTNYSGTTSAQGIKIVEATTDADGKYSLTVPCGQKPVKVEVQPRGFTAPYYILAGTTVSETKAYFEDNAKTINVVMGDKITENFFNVAKQSEEPIVSRNINLNIKGELLYNRPADHVDYSSSTTQKADPGIKMILTLVNTTTSEEMVYNLTTGSNGSIAATVKIFDSWKLGDIKATLKVLPYVTDYTKNDNSTVNGYYKIDDISITLDETATLEGIGQNIGKNYMDFLPL